MPDSHRPLDEVDTTQFEQELAEKLGFLIRTFQTQRLIFADEVFPPDTRKRLQFVAGSIRTIKADTKKEMVMINQSFTDGVDYYHASSLVANSAQSGLVDILTQTNSYIDPLTGLGQLKDPGSIRTAKAFDKLVEDRAELGYQVAIEVVNTEGSTPVTPADYTSIGDLLARTNESPFKNIDVPHIGPVTSTHGIA